MNTCKKYCGLCKKYFYSDYGTHYNSCEHKLKSQRRREAIGAKERQQSDELEFKLQLASALEGYTLNPGDEVQLRDGRFFKADIHGTLFEIPVGS